jgi:EmrB/QacA subfamily drug resistance transporter
MTPELRKSISGKGIVIMISETAHQDQPPAKDIYKWKALVTVALGTMMATMDASITNIAFPALTRVFQADVTIVVWVTVIFVLVSTSSMLIIGKIGDLMGRKRIYTIGMGIFTLGLVVCSLAQDIGQLIFFRALQAIGAAMTISTSTAIVTEAFPGNEVGRGIGFLGMSVSVGFIIGPILGGFLLDWLDWRSIFYVRAPISLVIIFLALFLLRRDQVQEEGINLDLMGTFSSSAGIFLFVFGISQIRKYGLSSPWVNMIVGLGLIFVILFILVEGNAEDPIVDLELFKNKVFSSAIWALFLTFVAVPPYILVIPFYLIQGRSMNPAHAGMLMAVTSMVTMVIGPLSGTLSDRYGPFKFSAIGAGTICAGYGLMSAFDLQTPLTFLIPVLFLLGIGIGSFHPSNNSIVMSAVKRDRLGTASALIATLRQVGIAVGMAVTGTLFSARLLVHKTMLYQEGISEASAESLSIPPAFHDTLIFGICLQSIVFVLCFVRGNRGKGPMSRSLSL